MNKNVTAKINNTLVFSNDQTYRPVMKSKLVAKDVNILDRVDKNVNRPAMQFVPK